MGGGKGLRVDDELTSFDNGLPSVTDMQHQRLSDAFLLQPTNGISVCIC